MIACKDLAGDCCEECHEDALDDAGTLEQLQHAGVTAEVCCAKIDAARERLGLPKPERVTVARNVR